MGLAGHWLSYAKYARSRLQTVPGELALVDFVRFDRRSHKRASMHWRWR